MQPELPIIATLTSADGQHESYLTKRDAELFAKGLCSLFVETIRLNGGVPMAPSLLCEIENLRLKLNWLKGPNYV